MAVGSSPLELLTALQKAGAPINGTSYDMSAAIPGLKQNVQDTVYGQDTVVPDLRNKYKGQLDALAAMDQKLAGVYGDPSSPLYIERASSRQSAISGARNTGQKEVGRIQTQAKTRKSELDTQVNDAVSLFRQLEAVQKQEENLAAKAAKSSNKKTASQKAADASTRAQAIKQKQWDLAGLSDSDAIATFERAPKDFQDQWVREYQSALQSGDAGTPDQQQYTANDIKGAWTAWDEKTKKPKATTKKSLF